MFSNLIFRNSRQSQKENSLFFSSLVISIIAFYIILSLSSQDVMRFLKTMESDAVSKLMALIPVFYIMTLGILFFLIYFACKYQLQRRRHEFGVYLMLGMKRSRLFAMLLAEDLLTSILALLIGLPTAILLSELISLITAKLVGLGIIGHQFSLSASGLAFTVAGFLLIKLTAFSILSTDLCRQEIGELLTVPPGCIKKRRAGYTYLLSLLLGLLMLAAAYTMAILGISWENPDAMLMTGFLGISGTFLLFHGMKPVIEYLAKTGKGKLHAFNFRQTEENVIQHASSMAVSSLLILAALCCFGAGIGIAASNSRDHTHVLDYTFSTYGEIPSQEIFPSIQKFLKKNHLEDKFSELFPMRLGYIQTADKDENVLEINSVMKALQKLPRSQTRDILLNNFGYVYDPYIICQSDYNKLLTLAKKPVLDLKSGEAAVYISPELTNPEQKSILDQIFSSRPKIQLNGIPLTLTGKLQSLNLVTDRSITLSFALILPDEQFFRYTQGQYSVYVNGVLQESIIEKTSLMNAMASVNIQLGDSGLDQEKIQYESYLQNMGRQLFYMVAASYITIYLSIIFLVTANTILGVQFLMYQKKTERRYQTLIRLGADYEVLCRSARKQILWFMGLPAVFAALSSLLGVKALFAGILPRQASGDQTRMLLLSAAMIALLLVVEYIYITMIRRSSDRFLLTLMQPQREE